MCETALNLLSQHYPAPTPGPTTRPPPRPPRCRIRGASLRLRPSAEAPHGRATTALRRGPVPVGAIAVRGCGSRAELPSGAAADDEPPSRVEPPSRAAEPAAEPSRAESPTTCFAPPTAHSHSPQNNLAREGVERHRGVLPTCEEDCPPSASSGPIPTASAAAVAEAWPAMTIATARSFLGLVSGGMPANLCCDGGGRRHDTNMILSSARLQRRTVSQKPGWIGALQITKL